MYGTKFLNLRHRFHEDGGKGGEGDGKGRIWEVTENPRLFDSNV